MKCVNQFLDCIWTHPDVVIQYRASEMILGVHSDASCLSAPKTCNHANDGYSFLSTISLKIEIQLNWMGLLFTSPCTILKLVATSAAAEAKLGALLHNSLRSSYSSLWNLATHKSPPQNTLTTQQLSALSTMPSSANVCVRLKCNTFGYWMAKLELTLAIISPGIILPTYINMSDHIYVHMDKSHTLVPWAMKSSWRKPPRKVSYKHTFGASDQG